MKAWLPCFLFFFKEKGREAIKEDRERSHSKKVSRHRSRSRSPKRHKRRRKSDEDDDSSRYNCQVCNANIICTGEVARNLGVK